MVSLLSRDSKSVQGHFKLKVKSDLVKKGWKVLWDVVEKSDVVLEILDIRDPEAFRNKTVEERVKRMGKVLILVLNKADLVPKPRRD